MYKLGLVSARTIEMHERESQRLGKSSFHYAWVMDESQSERDHGVTINATTKYVVFNYDIKKLSKIGIYKQSQDKSL